MRRPLALVCALVVVGAVAGCERGCATRALDAVRDPRGARSRDEGPAALGGTDCSDGLARCTAGNVEVSRLAHLPDPCEPGSPEARTPRCTCPWDPAGACATGCAADGAVVIADAETARVQLCRPDAPIARPPLPAELGAEVCTSSETTCRDGFIRICERAGAPSRVVAACLHGCEAKVTLGAFDDLADGPAVPLDGAAAILCSRPTAERR